MMILLTIALSLLSLVLIFAVTKALGNKQVSQMNMFDYVMGITVGSIAAELATELVNPIQPIVALLVYGLIGFLIAFLTMKSIKLRMWITGKPIILMEKDILYKSMLSKVHLDINDFLTIARLEGYYDISQIDTAIFEHTGKISFLPKPQYRPATPNDLKLPAQKDYRFLNVIEDGNIMENELRSFGYDHAWLMQRLKENGYESVRDVFLMTMDQNETLHFYPMNPKQS